MDKEDFELAKEVQYWAGRLIGYDQAYDVAEEIVEAMKYAETKAENLPISGVTLRSGVGFIAQERRRQIDKEGWAAEHDDEHHDGSLAQAAAAYASKIPELWPWEMEWWKPSVNDRKKDLIKAGALIAAEIDRIIRAEGNEG